MDPGKRYIREVIDRGFTVLFCGHLQVNQSIASRSLQFTILVHFFILCSVVKEQTTLALMRLNTHYGLPNTKFRIKALILSALVLPDVCFRNVSAVLGKGLLYIS
jgi:hypothetical protein